MTRKICRMQVDKITREMESDKRIFCGDDDEDDSDAMMFCCGNERGRTGVQFVSPFMCMIIKYISMYYSQSKSDRSVMGGGGQTDLFLYATDKVK